jgi:uncharacterized protein with FMN-binding domain
MTLRIRNSAPTRIIAILRFAILLALPLATSADTIEFLNGSRLEGSVTAIDTKGKTVTFRAVVAGRASSQTYGYGQIHAVTMKGRRHVLTPKPASDTPSSPDAGAAQSRSKAEVEALIRDVGSTPPSWLGTTRLNYPATLDLNWPMPAPKPWNRNKNVGQFIWDTVNPNTGRWREGVRLMYHLLDVHKRPGATRTRVMTSLASMYFRFFQDYPRAAWWWRRAGTGQNGNDAVALAECYFRMGSKEMAKDALRGQPMRAGMIKLLGDMGETDAAVSLADRYVKAGGAPQEAHLLAGDACRLAHRAQEAIERYQKAIDAPARGQRAKRLQKFQDRARASMAAIKLFDLSDARKVADGTYRDGSLGYAGRVEVEVAVKSGRIESVKVVKHQEKQFYSALRDTPAQIVAKQGVKGVDATSRATITAEAIINASAKALAKGAK